MKRKNFFELLFYILSCLIFSFGHSINLNWKIGWVFIFLSSSSFLVYHSYLIIFNKELLYHLVFFNLGIIVFLLTNPMISIFNSEGFPLLYYISNDNILANRSGFIISIYYVSFYLMVILYDYFARNKNYNLKKNILQLKIQLNPFLIFSLVIISIFPFFFYGSGEILENFSNNLNARQSGYVAFTTAGLGTENPFIVLMVQFLPVSIILLFIKILNSTLVFKFIYFPILIFLVILAISTGGRGLVITVFIFALLYFLYFYRFSFLVLFIPISLLVSEVLTFQINNRYAYSRENEKNYMTGYDLNKELAFIVENFDSDKFMNSDSKLKTYFGPILETGILFITNPIPRIFWKNKPYDKSFSYYNSIRFGETGLGRNSNITPTIPGRFFLKYGFSGVIQIGLLIGLIFSFANVLLERSLYYKNINMIIFSFLLLSILFISVREFAPGKFYSLIILYIVLYTNKLIT